MPPDTPKLDGAKLLELEAITAFLNSDGLLEVLLGRLKQSINTGEEISRYVKKKAMIEDEHYTQLKKAAAHTRQLLKTGKNLKSDSFSSRLDQLVEFDEKIQGVGLLYVKALNVMYDEILLLVSAVTRLRKTLKDESKRREKDCADAIAAAEKAKQKYYHLCDDLEKLKTLDPSKKSFLKNKTAEQQEDDLQRKVDLADQEYRLKVAALQRLKDELLLIHRPVSSKKLRDLILEMDIALNVQLQKLATWTETLIMNSGVLISPLQPEKLLMKLIALSIDNELDLYNYLSKNSKTQTSRALVPVEYVAHPLFAKSQPKPFFKPAAAAANTLSASVASTALSKSVSNDKDEKFTYNSLDPTKELNGPKPLAQVQYAQPTFGVSIEEVIKYAGIDNVPLVVKRCIDIVETYGIDIEGIYRTSGNKTSVQHLKSLIDSNFANYLLVGNTIEPENVMDADIYCTASLLKTYFASLPEPLLTQEHYQLFIDTVKLPDESFIAKKLHHLVYNLPDGAYFTLRALIFHLNKVASHQQQNRMTPKSLAIIWGPALLNDNSSSPQDLSYKSKVVEELMLIANEIFDADE